MSAMLPKLILVVSCFCVVQAAFVINAPDNESPSPVENEVEISKDDNDDVNKINDEVPVSADDYSVAESDSMSGFASSRMCDNVACSQFCRSRGYIFGSCFGVNICRCFRARFGLNEYEDLAKNEVEPNKDDSDDSSSLKDEEAPLVEDYSVPQQESTGESEAASGFASARACTNGVCNRFCEMRGFAWGQCISISTCRCYRFRHRQSGYADLAHDELKSIKADNVAAKKPNDVADLAEDFSVPQPTVGDDSEAASGFASARACTHAVCNRFCVSRGYRWGHCVGANVCRCYRSRLGLSEFVDLAHNDVESNKADNKDVNVNEDADLADDFSVPQPASESASEASGFASARACTNAVCNRFCVSRGYRWGHCVSANICRCYRFRRSLSEHVDLAHDEVESNKADNEDANKLNEEADLADDYSVPQPALEGSSEAASGFASARACTNAVCNRFCVSRGYRWGHCVSANICRCYRFRRSLSEHVDLAHDEIESNKADNEDANKLNEEADLADDYSVPQPALEGSSEAASGFASARACTNAVCNRFCVSRGYRWGHCVSANVCRCYRFRSAAIETDEVKKDENNAEIATGQNADSDNSEPARDAVEAENDINFNRNAENDLIVEQVNLDESLASEQVRGLSDCNLRWCEQNCRRIGFPGGACVNGRCKCDLMRSARPSFFQEP